LDVSLRFLVGGDLIEKFRRLPGNHGTSVRNSADRLRIGLMHRTAGQDFDSLILTWRRLNLQGVTRSC
jgi:hypothetical protein